MSYIYGVINALGQNLNQQTIMNAYDIVQVENNYLPLAGGTMTGNLVLNANAIVNTGKNLVINDSALTPNTLSITGPSAITSSYTLKVPTSIGTNNQVLVLSSVAGTIGQLGWSSVTSFNQSLNTTNSVAFASVTLNNQGALTLFDSTNTHYVGFRAPSSVSSNAIWTLPLNDGSNNQVLTTNGSAVLSWVTPFTPNTLVTGLNNMSAYGIIVNTSGGVLSRSVVSTSSNKIIVTNGDGTTGNITLDLPQFIDTTASPSFYSITASKAGVYSSFAGSVTISQSMDNGTITPGGGTPPAQASNVQGRFMGSLIQNKATTTASPTSTDIVRGSIIEITSAGATIVLPNTSAIIGAILNPQDGDTVTVPVVCNGSGTVTSVTLGSGMSAFNTMPTLGNNNSMRMIVRITSVVGVTSTIYYS